MYHQPPLTEQEIARLPLVFVPPQHYEHEEFTAALIATWVALTESGSLATLPPVPDIVGFVDMCTVFYLIYHTKPSQLGIPPDKRLTSRPSSPYASSSSSSSPPSYSSSPGKDSPSKASKRPHPYAHARPSSSKNYVDLTDEDDNTNTNTDDDLTDREVIGCVYLAYNTSIEGCADIGIALRPEARGRGYGRAAITYLLRIAFEQHGAHRVVANVFGPTAAEPNRGGRESMNIRWMFEKLGFVPEGVQRLAGFSATDGVWRDVYPLSMLDLDWLALTHRSAGRESMTSPWESMIERHDKERDQMMDWMDEGSYGKLRRVASTDTVKGLAAMETVDDPATDTDETSVEEPEHQSSTTDYILDLEDEDDLYETIPDGRSPPAPESVPSDQDWRSSTPSTDFSVISHSPPPPPHISDSDWYTDSDFDTDGFESLDEGSTRGPIHTTD